MSSKAAIIGITDPTEPDTAAEEREGLLRSSREQEIRNRAYEIYLQRGDNLAMNWRIGCRPNARSQRISLVAQFCTRTGFWLRRATR